MDFSSDGRLLRSIGNSAELRYWNLADSQEIVLNSGKTPKASKKEVKEASWLSVVKFGWETSQLWRDFEDTDLVNVVSGSESREYVAVGEDDNCVRLYRNPCVSGKNRRFRAHGGNVLNVCWLEGDRRLASVGADRCLVIWKVSEL